MADEAESELIALVAQEQRGLRRILVAGFSALFLVVAMSTALGVYYYFIAQDLAADSARLERRAFDTRILADDLADRISDQEAAIRRNYSEMLNISQNDLEEATVDDQLDTAVDFLERGVRTLSGERLLERAVQETPQGRRSDLFRGVLALLEWERTGGEIPRDAAGLPERLEEARGRFASASEAPALRAVAQTGLAWIEFENASSPRSSYGPADCEAVFASTAEIGEIETIGPQPLYWRGQCARKLGRVREALQSYSLAVRRSQQSMEAGDLSVARREAQLLLEMNAFHGLGTVLIAAANTSDNGALSSARALASEACEADQVSEGSEQTRLMHACLQKAVALRRRLRQTENQISGTRENLSFVYLIDDNFEGAFENTMQVETTGLFAWNELIRATVANEVGESAAARNASRNVSLFRSAQFNMCEIQKLLKPEHFDLAYDILLREHPDFALACDVS